LHPKYRTPAFSTLLTGVLVAVPSLFMNLKEVTDLTSIGTLFAFVLVSGGVLVLDGRGQSRFNPEHKGFRIPYISSRYVLPLIWIVVLSVLWIINADGVMTFFDFGAAVEDGTINHQIPLLIFIPGGGSAHGFCCYTEAFPDSCIGTS
jgi:basic amino acid/polyamine antiporter, APA family